MPTDPVDSDARTVLETNATADAEVAFLQPEDRYELRALLGEGGMGEVALCKDVVIGREVALKSVLRARADDPAVRQRFVREARVQGQLEHPSIVPVYDCGVDRDGRMFFTMKRVRGETLADVLDAAREGSTAYGRHKLLAAFVQVCQAVAYAHDRGVLHRDLKPANVMLGRFGEVYVLDWGLAKLHGASREIDSQGAIAIAASGDGNETVPGAIAGTPAYMAPEQILGEPLDGRADVYALGAILFEILTLEPLHGDGSLAAIMKRVLAGVDVRARTRDVPPELVAICADACARERDKRLAGAALLAERVEAYLAGDRDVAMRRALAMEHIERARAATKRALEGADADRTEALREAGRAVALAPTDPAALEVLTTLLATPPRDPPPEVLDAVEATRREAHRKGLLRVGTGFLLAWVVWLPIPAMLGIRDVALIAIPLAAWMASAIAAFACYRWFAALGRTTIIVAVFAQVAIALSSLLLGPLLLVPAMAMGGMLASLLVAHRSMRPAIVGTAVLAVLVPTAFAWTGHHPVTHDVIGRHVLAIGVSGFDVTRDAVFAFASILNLVVFGVAANFATKYRDMLTEMETRNQLHAWQLRKLVPGAR